METYGTVNTGRLVNIKGIGEETQLNHWVFSFIYVGVVELADTSDLSPDAL